MGTLLVSGAGISSSAGIKTYRDRDGLWSDENFEKMSHANKYGNYLDVLIPKWYSLGKSFESIEPTLFHKVVAAKGWKIITQNIDGLHQKAGSKDVIEIHGNITEWIDMKNRRTFNINEIIYDGHEGKYLSPFNNYGKIRPNIVLFGEKLHQYKVAQQWVRSADTIVFAGTSGNVYPVADFYLSPPRSILIDPNKWGSFSEYYEMAADDWATNHVNSIK